MVFSAGDRVQRVAKTWGNISAGMTGTVQEVLAEGEKLRVLFDTYRNADRHDETVIVMAKTMRQVIDLTPKAVWGPTPPQPQLPIRGDPFAGARTRISINKVPKVASVEHVDLTVPFHKQAPARQPDWTRMTDHEPSEDMAGLVGEGLDEDVQTDLSESIDDMLNAPKRPRRPTLTPRAQIRALLPFTAWEIEMRRRRFNSEERVQVDAIRREVVRTTCVNVRRADSLEKALDKTLAVSTLLHK